MRSITVSANLKTAYFLSFVNQLFFPIAVWLFFYSKFLDFKQIAMMVAIGGVSAILLEIPTGAFADIIGRKKAIFLSYLLFTVTMIVTAYSHTFNVFILLALANGLVNALYSGSLEALVYDTLKESNQEKEYDHVISRMETLAWLGLFAGSVTGGFLFTLSYRLPFLAQAGFTLAAALLALRLREPRLESQHHKISDFVIQNTKGFKELFQTRITTRLALLFIILGAGYDIAASILGISQAKEYGIGPEMVGIIFACGYIISAMASHFYPQLKRKLGNKTILLLVAGAILSSFIFAKFVGVAIGIGLIILRISSSTIFRNTKSTTLNPFYSSGNRATALSTINLLTMLPYVVLAYFIGDYIDKTSPNNFAFLLGIGMVLTLVIIETVFWIIGRIKLKRQKSKGSINVMTTLKE
jgi:MFS family permease